MATPDANEAPVEERLDRLITIIGLASVGEFTTAIAHFEAMREDAFGLLEEGLRIFITELKATHEEREQALAELVRANQDIEQKLALIESQRLEIRELSTPVLEIWDDVLAVPIVGNLSHARTLEVTERLLQRVVETRARWALIDLTGVDEVDAETADHLVKLVVAVKLVGGRCVVTGVSPTVAHTLVALDSALGELQCTPNLREGLRRCLAARSGARRGA